MLLSFSVGPLIWVASVVHGAFVPNTDWSAALGLAALIVISYLPYVHHWFAPAYVPKAWWKTETAVFASWVCFWQKLLWVAYVLAYMVTWSEAKKRVFAQPPLVLLLCVAAFVLGQVLNVAVFNALGYKAVYYGHRYGVKAPWIKGWPFVIPDPQYTGVSLCVMASAYAIRSWDEGSSSMLSSVKGGDNSVVLGAAAGNALAHLMLIAMENRGETRHKAKAKDDSPAARSPSPAAGAGTTTKRSVSRTTSPSPR
jgi:hypothetical protein